MQRRVADNAAFSDLVFANFKLRFNERKKACVFFQIFDYRGNNNFQGNKGNIDCNQINGVRQGVRGHFSDIGALDNDNPRILTEFPGKLSIADIHGIYALRTVL